MAAGSASAHEIFEQVHTEVRPKCRPARVEFGFFPFANANSSVRLEQGVLFVRVSDVLETAPPEILKALAFILLSKLYRRPVPKQYRERYRRYLNGREVRQTLQSVHQARGHKLASAPSGTHYDLEQIFEDLNFRFFFGLMARPALGWSLRVSRSTLGHYDPSHHTIVISKLLDDTRVPRLAVEFVMFHEMLHLRYPVEHRGGRRCIHTPEFQNAEKQFPGYQQAKELLKSL